jgi:probable F420-dependent oxidoreductase
MRYGVSVGLYPPGGGASPETFVQLATEAERLGFDSIWTGDHIVMPEVYDQGPHIADVRGEHPGRADSNLFEPISTYCYLAGQVSRVRLGIGVLIVPYRNPILAAKMLTMLDVLSNGRLVLGVGTGWMREEFAALGAPPYSQRGSATNEYLELFIKLWTETSISFSGKHYQVSGIGFLPKPVQKPHPPIWVGGNGEVALRRTVRYGQGWMPVYQTPEEIREKIALLGRMCNEAGRNPDEISKVLGCRFQFQGTERADGAHHLIGTPQHMIDTIHRFEETGIEQIHLMGPGGASGIQNIMDTWRRFAEEVAEKV